MARSWRRLPTSHSISSRTTSIMSRAPHPISQQQLVRRHEARRTARGNTTMDDFQIQDDSAIGGWGVPEKDTRDMHRSLSAVTLRLVSHAAPVERPFTEFVGRSRALQAVLRQVEIVAPTDSTVLVLG